VVDRFNTRFECICSTNASVAAGANLSVSMLPEEYAMAIMRYTVGIVHIHYMSIDGAISPGDWKFLVLEDILTRDEVAVITRLVLEGSPPASILVIWNLKLLHRCQKQNFMNQIEVRK